MPERLFGITADQARHIDKDIADEKRHGRARPNQRPRAERPGRLVPRQIMGKLTEPLNAGDTSFTLDNIYPVLGANPTTSSTSEVTIANPQRITGSTGEWVRAQFTVSGVNPNSTDKRWEGMSGSGGGAGNRRLIGEMQEVFSSTEPTFGVSVLSSSTAWLMISGSTPSGSCITVQNRHKIIGTAAGQVSVEQVPTTDSSTAWVSYEPDMTPYTIRYGLAQAGTTWTNRNTTGEFPVSIKMCDSTGGNESTAALTAYTGKLGGNKATAIFPGDVIQFRSDYTGKKIVTSDAYDMRMGALIHWDSTAALPDGWTDVTNARGRVIIGVKSGSTFATAGLTGGSSVHGTTDHVFQSTDHALARTCSCLVQSSTGLQFGLTAPASSSGSQIIGTHAEVTLTHEDKNHMNPWYAAYHIKRTS